MPSLKPILTTLAVALALGAASQSPMPAFAQVFVSRMDQGKKECTDKGGKFEGDYSANKYTCTYAKDHKVAKCEAATGKCTTSDIPATAPAPAPKQASGAPGKVLLGLGDVSKAELKNVCARNKEWLFNVESSGAFSCVDGYDGIAVNCKKEKDCTMVQTPVHHY